MPFVELTPHDTDVGLPDELTALRLNYLWRRRVAAAITAYFEEAIGSEISDPDVNTTRENFKAMLLDLYNPEVLTLVAKHIRLSTLVNQSYVNAVQARLKWIDNPPPDFYDVEGWFDDTNNRIAIVEAGVYQSDGYLWLNEFNRTLFVFMRAEGSPIYLSANIQPATALLGSIIDWSVTFRATPGQFLEMVILPQGGDVTALRGAWTLTKIGNIE